MRYQHTAPQFSIYDRVRESGYSNNPRSQMLLILKRPTKYELHCDVCCNRIAAHPTYQECESLMYNLGCPYCYL